jgi:hypothetical protein
VTLAEHGGRKYDASFQIQNVLCQRHHISTMRSGRIGFSDEHNRQRRDVARGLRLHDSAATEQQKNAEQDERGTQFFKHEFNLTYFDLQTRREL